MKVKLRPPQSVFLTLENFKRRCVAMRKKCVLCGYLYSEEDLTKVLSSEGQAEVCLSCWWDTEECLECHEKVITGEGICPSCGAEF